MKLEPRARIRVSLRSMGRFLNPDVQGATSKLVVLEKAEAASSTQKVALMSSEQSNTGECDQATALLFFLLLPSDVLGQPGGSA